MGAPLFFSLQSPIYKDGSPLYPLFHPPSIPSASGTIPKGLPPFDLRPERLRS